MADLMLIFLQEEEVYDILKTLVEDSQQQLKVNFQIYPSRLMMIHN